MPVAEDPGQQIMLFQVCLCQPVGQHKAGFIVLAVIVVEENHFFVRRDLSEVIAHICRHVAFRIFGLYIAMNDGGDDIMNAADLKGVHNRAVNAFKQRFAVFSPIDIVVVADGIPDGDAHGFIIHVTDMCPEAVNIADIAGVDDKGGVSFFHSPAQFFKPFSCPSGTNFAVCHM